MSDETTGLENRYTVTRNGDDTGKHDDCEFFVLDLTHDPIARRALMTYAACAQSEGYVALTRDLNSMLTRLPEPWPNHDRPTP